jgi:Fe-S-cluster-containing hydrogenase component 2
MQVCDLCGACVGICPTNCMDMSEHLLEVVGEDCIKCGFCLPTCPLGALSWNEDNAKTNGSGGVE